MSQRRQGPTSGERPSGSWALLSLDLQPQERTTRAKRAGRTGVFMDNEDPTRRAEIRTVQAARDYLEAKSAVARAMPTFRTRQEQLFMADAVEEALAEGRHLVVEAGTGVGKSFAYLVPALLTAADRRERRGPVAVATRTIALQEQLVERDIPLLIEALGLDV